MFVKSGGILNAEDVWKGPCGLADGRTCGCWLRCRIPLPVMTPTVQRDPEHMFPKRSKAWLRVEGLMRTSTYEKLLRGFNRTKLMQKCRHSDLSDALMVIYIC